ncbi:glutamate synthase central domain-containing protein [Virgibacillus profundi]|uniref:glutamate synthase central domain-containing protein n=1 Tax=Virgibacillus profundi TaxID=2024555 RepID=UPI0013FE259B|nr:glutamate synthase central domain-containing protein [Virgibacillus profundi]
MTVLAEEEMTSIVTASVNYVKSVAKERLKIMSKMGISTMQRTKEMPAEDRA